MVRPQGQAANLPPFSLETRCHCLVGWSSRFAGKGEGLKKIRKITVEVLRVTVDQAYVAAGRSVEANWHVLARVTTADGIELNEDAVKHYQVR